ncbi:unannotated protein [freshwater metagenome]|uniref:Unannotated protein n=1 Tax=freshwater metagenome TaxID=449393 RepID=A0A6J7RRF4_9ZZZZ
MLKFGVGDAVSGVKWITANCQRPIAWLAIWSATEMDAISERIRAISAAASGPISDSEPALASGAGTGFPCGGVGSPPPGVQSPLMLITSRANDRCFLEVNADFKKL